MSKEKIKELENLPFEQALEKLEKTVEKMEAGDMPLDNMIKSFEEATVLAGVCGKKLKSIEKKIEVLIKEDEKNGQWQDFDPSSERHNKVETEENFDDDEPDEESLF